jgi:hypothetical protein
LELLTIQGRAWLLTTGKLDVDGRYDSYTTLVGDKKWLASRMEIMRKVMDRVIVIEPRLRPSFTRALLAHGLPRATVPQGENVEAPRYVLIAEREMTPSPEVTQILLGIPRHGPELVTVAAGRSCGLAHPGRNIAIAMKNAPDINVIAAFDIEDQVRVLLQGPEPQTRQV